MKWNTHLVNTSEQSHQAPIPYILNTKSHFLSTALHSHCNWEITQMKTIRRLGDFLKTGFGFWVGNGEVISLQLIKINEKKKKELNKVKKEKKKKKWRACP